MYPESEIVILGDSPYAPEPETTSSPRKMAVPAKNRSSRNLFGSRKQAEIERQPSSVVSRKRTHPSEAHFDQLVASEVKRSKLIDENACWEMARNMVKQINSATKKAILRNRRRENEARRRPRRDHSRDEEDGHNDYAKTVFAYRFASESPDEKRSPKKPWPQMNFYGSLGPVEKSTKITTTPASSSSEAKPAKE